MAHAKIGDTVLLINDQGKRFFTCLKPDHKQHTHQGIIEHNDLIDRDLGRKIFSSTGHAYVVVEPSTAEMMKEIRRNTQIVYPKEAGRIILKLNIFAGRQVIEAGTGSGGLTVALARYVAPTGRVFSYEVRPEMMANAQANLEKAGLDSYVTLKQRNINDGFDETDIDTVFLDVREPWRYLEQVKAALKPSGFFGAILPTTNQITHLLQAFKQFEFDAVEVEETLLRKYKPIPGRLRPQDTMVGHTGYLIFARNLGTGIFPQPHRRAASTTPSES